MKRSTTRGLQDYLPAPRSEKRKAREFTPLTEGYAPSYMARQAERMMRASSNRGLTHGFYQDITED